MSLLNKLSFLILITILSSLNSIAAQNVTSDYGATAGVNYSNYLNSNNSSIEYTGKIGFYAGGFASFDLNDNFTIVPELIVSFQGSDVGIKRSNLNIFDPFGVPVSGSIEGKLEETLLIMPLLVHYNLSKPLSVFAGPQFGYVLKRDVIFENNDVGIGFSNDNKDKFEFNLSVGFGYNIIESARLLLRYNYGVIKRFDLNSSVFQLGVQYDL
jgi:hypothetical protein